MKDINWLWWEYAVNIHRDVLIVVPDILNELARKPRKVELYATDPK